jgi:uncharacterized protein YqgQ
MKIQISLTTRAICFVFSHKTDWDVRFIHRKYGHCVRCKKRLLAIDDEEPIEVTEEKYLNARCKLLELESEL